MEIAAVGLWIWITTAGLGSWLAGQKGYGQGVWFLACLLFPAAILALVGAPARPQASGAPAAVEAADPRLDALVDRLRAR